MSYKHYRVLITRPEKQGRELAKTLSKSGFSVHRTPFFDYQSKATTAQCRQLLSLNPDLFIFVSAAAVEFADQLLPLKQWPKATWIAIGLATREKLNAYGIETVICPSIQTSEGVMSLADVQHPKNKHIVIVRGNSGREYLAEQLSTLGATVQYLESYQRHWFELTTDTVNQWQIDQINCITITSNDLLESVVQLINNQEQIEQKNFWQNTCLWLVASERIASNAKALGLKRVVCSYGASDEAILNALHKMEQDYDRKEKCSG